MDDGEDILQLSLQINNIKAQHKVIDGKHLAITLKYSSIKYKINNNIIKQKKGSYIKESEIQIQDKNKMLTKSKNYFELNIERWKYIQEKVQHCYSDYEEIIKKQKKKKKLRIIKT